jgi:outer membrane lipoprotein-sorting protein
MISGKKTSDPRRRLAAAGVALTLLASAAPALALDLPDLMALLAGRTSGQARFTEQRFVKGFDAPLVSSGTLSFAAPDQFTRRTLEPRAESVVVNGNQLTLTRNGRSRSYPLDAAPEAAVAVEAIRGALTGNAAALQREFDVGVGGDAEHWTLTLTPRDARPHRSPACGWRGTGTPCSRSRPGWPTATAR